MVTKTSEEILVETDFLFGLNPEDKLNEYVKKIINQHNRGKIICKVAGTALMEFRAVLYSHGLSSKEVYEALLIILNVLSENKIEVISIKPQHLIMGDLLRTKYNILTFFDALHAGVAYEEGIKLVSNDNVYSKIKEIEFMQINKFLMLK